MLNTAAKKLEKRGLNTEDEIERLYEGLLSNGPSRSSSRPVRSKTPLRLAWNTTWG